MNINKLRKYLVEGQKETEHSMKDAINKSDYHNHRYYKGYHAAILDMLDFIDENTED
jgi:hypothetical protein